jgi:hypothetical protein
MLMRAILICPDERNGVAALAGWAPLSNLPILDKSLLEYWLEHLAVLGAKEVDILSSDRPDEVRNHVGDGARWGIRITVQAEKCEWEVDDVRVRYQTDKPSLWLTAPNDVVLMDYLPGLPHLPIFRSYLDWFTAGRALMPKALTADRIGVRELTSGIWVGLHIHVAMDAKLIAPCWIGENVWIEAGAVIGPDAVLERNAFVAKGAEISKSIIGPETFVGQFTEIHNSIALGDTLVNWERDSYVKITDEFLLSSLHPHRSSPASAKISAILRVRDYVSQVLTSVFAESGPRP